MEVETEGGNAAKLKQALLPPPPPSPPLPRRLWVATKPAVTVSVTNQEITMFWRQKRMEEEDHLLAAIKAAARIKAHKLTADEYKRFEESLKEDAIDSKESQATGGIKDDNIKELRVGIKDWWTKSKYAYLNEPGIKSRTTSTYIPFFYNYKMAAPPPTSSFGIF